MFIDPLVHERFVQDFGLNMLNTLTSKSLRVTAHRRRIHVFDERGGVIGGSPTVIQTYRNMTTGVFHSRTRRVVGVRYRCDPDGVEQPALGAFHTHPALYDDDIEKVKRRIDRLLWMSDLDIEAFRQQHRVFGYQWHFIGCIDIACFHYRDIRKGILAPRYILRYPHLERLMVRLRPEILHYDNVLRSANDPALRAPLTDLSAILTELTQDPSAPHAQIEALDPGRVRQLSLQVAHECQLRGYSKNGVQLELEKLIPPQSCADHTALTKFKTFKAGILNSFERLEQLQ